MKNSIQLKAIAINLVIALLFVFIAYAIIYYFLGEKISMATLLINTIAINNKKEFLEQEKLELKHSHKLKEYPEYGSKIGNIYIKSIEVSLPLYYGDTLEILKNGIGLASAGGFPGEGESIICMGHNSKKMLNKLPKTVNGDIIKINTSYGCYNYEIYDNKIIDEKDFESLSIQEKEEILMLYTCYPVNNIGHASQRYVVYAKLIKN